MVFSVIIPTLQRSAELRPLVEQCAAHPLVAEVLVINNATGPLHWPSPKVRVLHQERNIFVNPAWNLGVREASAQWLAIVNDDVRFDDDVFDYVAKLLRRGCYGIIGPDPSCFERLRSGRIRHRIAPFFSFKGPFGTFMCMRRTDYVPIPEEMRIWGGDDWLFMRQRKPNAVLLSARFETDMGTTSASPEFQALRQTELERCRPILMPLYRTRWWHRPVEYLDRIRGTSYSRR